MVIADTPEANDVCGIYNGYRVNQPCRVCQFESGSSGVNFVARIPQDCILKAVEGANDLLSTSFGTDIERHGSIMLRDSF